MTASRSAFAARRTRIVQSCTRAVASCDPATLVRLEQMLAAIADGARLERYCVSSPPDADLPADMAQLLTLLDPPVGRA
ncbi:hypothetical protein [Rhodospirillum centenum]|uniref:Uncharacterized protein n=1 Tax=Rhodospirillum centenum (strain ATCC 51521 / SW) TaxID=414684 RepID=B6IQD8_RHOCS|nr:hypothetical protein [Rhodospirillum centenum]ACI97674.1 hypothetical protein RC1_0225 [Rhodospirillum centenum SW]